MKPSLALLSMWPVASLQRAVALEFGQAFARARTITLSVATTSGLITQTCTTGKNAGRETGATPSSGESIVLRRCDPPVGSLLSRPIDIALKRSHKTSRSAIDALRVCASCLSANTPPRMDGRVNRCPRRHVGTVQQQLVNSCE